MFCDFSLFRGFGLSTGQVGHMPAGAERRRISGSDVPLPARD